MNLLLCGSCSHYQQTTAGLAKVVACLLRLLMVGWWPACCCSDGELLLLVSGNSWQLASPRDADSVFRHPTWGARLPGLSN